METPERRPEDCESKISNLRVFSNFLVDILVIEVKLNNLSSNHEPINNDQGGCRC